jgi:4-amino-4-deoxy-L-arabinose transferase-like glycosyltransferase
VLLAIRLLLIATAPIDLEPDEAYYWDWSRRLDWGYYSKPPMIAWTIAASTSLLGSTAFAVRLPAVLLGVIATGAVGALGRRMYDARVGFWSAAAFAACPLFAGSGVLMTIDALLMCCWTVSLALIWHALGADEGGRAGQDGPGDAAASASAAGSERASNGAGWWIALIVPLGVGYLSKQMMLFVPVLVLLFLALSPPDRWRLRRPWPYVAFFVSLFALTPPLVWNARNGWVTFRHTAQHFAGQGREWYDFARTFGEFVGAELGLISPILWPLLLAVGVVALTTWRRRDRRVRFLLLFGVVPLAPFFLLALWRRVQGNWPGAFYPAGLVLLAAWGCGRLSAGRVDRLRRWFPRGVVLGAVLAAGAYLVPYVLALPAIRHRGFNPLARATGWSQAGREVGKYLAEVPRPDRTFVIAGRRQIVAEMAFYLPGQPLLFRWNDKDYIDNQYDWWPGPADRIGWDALLVFKDKSGPSRPHPGPPPELAERFASVRELGRVDLSKRFGRKRRYVIHLAESLQSWSSPTTASGPAAGHSTSPAR